MSEISEMINRKKLLEAEIETVREKLRLKTRNGNGNVIAEIKTNFNNSDTIEIPADTVVIKLNHACLNKENAHRLINFILTVFPMEINNLE